MFELKPLIFLAKWPCLQVLVPRVIDNLFRVNCTIRHGKTGGSGQSGHGSKRVIFKRVNQVTGQTGCRLSRVASRVKLTRIFQKKKFFFFEVDAICQVFMSSLTIIRFSLMILLPITTKHLTWYPNLVQLLFQLSRN